MTEKELLCYVYSHVSTYANNTFFPMMDQKGKYQINMYGVGLRKKMNICIWHELGQQPRYSWHQIVNGNVDFKPHIFEGSRLCYAFCLSAANIDQKELSNISFMLLFSFHSTFSAAYIYSNGTINHAFSSDCLILSFDLIDLFHDCPDAKYTFQWILIWPSIQLLLFTRPSS